MTTLPSHGLTSHAHRIALFVVLSAGLLISGCSGGSGGGSESDVSPTAPTASSGAVSTNEDTAVSGTLIGNDPDGDPLTYSIVTQGARGTATITNSATGAFTYSPYPNQFGSDSFTFKVSDGTSDSNTATIAVTILAVNNPPVAEAGNLLTMEDIPAAGILIATDVELHSLTYHIVSNGSKGTATIVNATTGAFIYTPAPDVNGTDAFTFIANDGLVDSSQATVTVTIDPVNDPPVATASCGTTRQAQALIATLQASDMESPTMLMYTLGDGSTGPLTTPNGGQVTITDTTNGVFRYTPLASGDGRGTDSFTFRVMDPEGEIDMATQTVIVDQTIMPLGDSITQGTIGPVPPFELRVGFRKPLQDTLIASGYSFDFVGTLSDGVAVPNFDFNHEGHGGWTASEIAWGRTGYPTDGVRAWLDINPSDFVLLHIGTNALDPNNDIDVEAILDEIDLWEGSAGGNPVTVILALIIDQDPINPDVVAFNNNVRAMANLRINNGDDIIIANHHDALNYPADMANQLHPTEVGYSKMATVWFNNLTALLEKCP